MASSAVPPPPLPTWPTPVVESRGDYREEEHLGRTVGGILYAPVREDRLPRLPVPPSLADSVRLLLPSALPLAADDDEAAALEREAADFLASAAGAELQGRLEARAAGAPDSSWLQKWWNQEGYLAVRDPVVVNVSYFIHLSDDRTLAPAVLRSGVHAGAARGAAMLRASAEFRRKVVTGELADRLGRPPKDRALCPAAYKYMFNACRVPRRKMDTYRLHDPSLHRHAVVARKGKFFTIKISDGEGHPLSLRAIEAQLEGVVRAAAGTDCPPLGLLTSSDRDTWADARGVLEGIPGVADALRVLESGAVLLCMDDEEPVSRDQCGALFWHGGLRSGRNRWFDKSVQLFVTDNGKAGMMGEHSMMDGMPVVGLADHITRSPYREASKAGGSAPPPVPPVHIFGACAAALRTDPRVAAAVAAATDDFHRLVTAHELRCQSFQGYGASAIKKMGFSPDAYVQLAMQLATTRLFGKQAGTYEASQTRPFLHGRTETTRTVTPHSAAFVASMGGAPYSDDAAAEDKRQALRDAVDAHVLYLRRAAAGLGCDRHLLGLAMLVAKGEDPPPLFSNPLLLRSKSWRVSTSNLSHPNFDNWGYGEVVPDGVGLAYSIGADSLVFNVTALAKHGYVDRLVHLLEEALLEMQDLHKTEAPRSKL